MIYCSKCGVLDEKGTLLTHRCSAINKVAINSAINRTDDRNPSPGGIGLLPPPINALDRSPASKDGSSPGRTGKDKTVAVRKCAGDRSPNRRTRDAYNAYMREYMRKKRNG